jgi:glycerophosphoryl diester phosphodiesterase
MVKKLRSKGLGIRAWGVFNVALMKKMCALNVDGMTVNFPDRLYQYLNIKKV